MTGAIPAVSECAVEARGLAKAYPSPAGPVEALRSVDLCVAPGEFIAIMGPSGCGKSTLLHLLGGLDRPTSGEVLVDGHPLNGLSDSALLIYAGAEKASAIILAPGESSSVSDTLTSASGTSFEVDDESSCATPVPTPIIPSASGEPTPVPQPIELPRTGGPVRAPLTPSRW